MTNDTGTAADADTRLAGPAFDVPEHYGDPGALDSLSSVSAPLLAGGTLALVGVIVQAPGSLRWPDAALLLLVATSVLLVSAVQCGFLARRHATNPAEMAAWWPTMPAAQRWQRIREEQWAEQARHRAWAARCRLLYGTGITTLWVGVGVALVPEGGMGVARVAAVVVALLAALAELAWSLAVHIRVHPALGRIPGLTRFGSWLDGASRPLPEPPPERWPWPPQGP